MAIEYEHIETERSDLLALRMIGTVASGDDTEFVDRVRELSGEDVKALVLDMSTLGSMSEDLAGELAVRQRRLVDQGGEMVFVAPNVVINWYLDRRFGPLPHRCFFSLDLALDALSPDAPPEGPSLTQAEAAFERILEPDMPEWSHDVNEAGRPDRLSFSVVHRALRNSAEPLEWLEPLRVMLRRTGLGASVFLCRRVGARMELVGKEVYQFPAEGWLGSLLVNADCPLSLSEIVGEGLTLHERAFLKWCDADVVVPLLDDDSRLQGTLFVKSARDGGLYTYRSSELLSLSLLGRLLGRFMTPAESEAQTAPQAKTWVSEPELQNI